MRSIICLTMLFSMISCAEKVQDRFATSGPEVDLIKATIAAYEAADWATWEGMYADTAKVYYNEWNTPVSHLEAEEGHKNTLALIDQYEFEDDPIFFEKIIDDNGDTWVNFWGHWVGTLAENGQQLEIPVHVSFQVKDGKIVEEHGFWDNAPMNAAIQELAQSKNAPEIEQKIKNSHDVFVEFWNKHDLEMLKSITTDKVVRYTNGNKAAANKEDYAAFAGVFFTAFPDLKFTLRDVTIKDGKSSHYWTGTGTNTGNFGENAPTGKKITTHGHTVITYDQEGKIVKDESYFDMLDMYQQLGYQLTPPAQ